MILSIRWSENLVTFDNVYCSDNCLDTPANVQGDFDEPEVFDDDLEAIKGLIISDDEAELARATEWEGTGFHHINGVSTDIAIAHHKEDNRTLEEKVPTQYHEFLDLFGEEEYAELPPHRPGFDCEINLKDGAELPKPSGVYAMSVSELDELKTTLDDLLAKGFIRPSTSQAAAPCFYIPKKNGKRRLVVDYRKLNDITIKDQYPIPLTSDLMDRLVDLKCFSKFDLKWGYNLLRITEGHEWKTAFKTRYGLFEYTVMPFGLCNAPAIFQRYVNHVLYDLLDKGVEAYLDDILNGAKNDDKKLTELTLEVFKRCRKHHLRFRAEKCSWHQRRVDFLGLWISENGVEMDEHKVEAILQWPNPQRVKDIQQFLGFANFYRRFIRNFSEISQSMTMLLRKGQPWLWGSEQQESFDTLKRLFSSAPILVHPDPERQYCVETDASDYAYGAILSQKQDDGKLHPNAFLSRSMTPAERNYDIYDKEMLAIVKALQEWRRYLQGAKHPIKILTDHKNLEYFKSPKILNPRQMRWADLISHYDFIISYRPGTQAGKPDALSRRPDHRPEGGAETPFSLLKAEHFRQDIVAATEVWTDQDLQNRIKTAIIDDPADTGNSGLFSSQIGQNPSPCQKGPRRL